MSGPGVWRRATVAAVLVSALAAGGAAAQETTGDEGPSSEEIEEDVARAEEERTYLRLRRELLTTEIVAATEELVSVRRQLADARARLARIRGQLALARQAAASAERRSEAAQRNVEIVDRQLLRAEEALTEQLEVLARQAAIAYKYGAPMQRSEAFLKVLQQATNPNDLANNIYKLRSVVDHQDEAIERVIELQEDLEELRAQADATRELADLRAKEAAQTLEVVSRLAAEASVVAAEVTAAEERQSAILSSLEADAATLEFLEGEVTKRIARLERDLEAQREREREQRVAAGGGLCPVVGAVAGRDFINDWGFPRSGGRTHEGTDIFASRGTPIVAMWSGTVSRVHRTEYGLGGLSVSYEVGAGQHIYNAHLDTVASGLEVGDPVEQGQVIGTVGNTGNARTTPPHLHIGHYVDGVAIPMWPVLSEAC